MTSGARTIAAQITTSRRSIVLVACVVMSRISRAWPSIAATLALARRRHPHHALAQAQIEHLHAYREGHREVNVTLGHVVIEAVGDKHDADHEEKCQSQHLDRRMAGDEAAYRAGERHHQQYRAHDGGDHYFEPVDHADCRD